MAGVKLNNPGPLRTALNEAQRGRCYLCGDPLGPRKSRGGVRVRSFNFDHVFPRRRYDFYQRGNLLLAHPDCNVKKGDREPFPCEVIYLAAINLALGLKPAPRPLSEHDRRYRDEQRAAAWLRG